ncbi:hypothetical protein DM01DRAFT_1333693 [Hesseltinella vesiculosa]|uniref:GmrSD restriction endonucleases N-terminal domain-containing protein n=1 Tax=Hesseltinella vesiculosa TaxID=101127 RepID=A0A1X2GNM3_9FUNG|nr:hypothetical protein DM01DRAFT_1333693 [Hesseltinella vesiculosa]
MGMLIDSVLKNYYIPPLIMTLRPNPSNPHALVNVCIDGKQRLTSINRFMDNQIPFIDDSYEPPRQVYYGSDDPNASVLGRETLTNAQREQFDNFQVTIMGYHELDEHEELEIFSRVQMGTSLTSAEKLQATNTPISNLVRLMLRNYPEIKSIMQTRRGQDFQLITQVACLLYSRDSDRLATPIRLMAFLQDPYIQLSSTFQRSLNWVFSKIREMNAQSTEANGYFHVVRHPTNGSRKRKNILTIEFLLLCKYLDEVSGKQRPIPELLEDLADLRTYIMYSYTGPAATGTPCYLAGLTWIEKRVALADRDAHEVAIQTSAPSSQQPASTRRNSRSHIQHSSRGQHHGNVNSVKPESFIGQAGPSTSPTPAPSSNPRQRYDNDASSQQRKRHRAEPVVIAHAPSSERVSSNARPMARRGRPRPRPARA